MEINGREDVGKITDYNKQIKRFDGIINEINETLNVIKECIEEIKDFDNLVDIINYYSVLEERLVEALETVESEREKFERQLEVELNLDYDGDGRSNRQEIIEGTDLFKNEKLQEDNNRTLEI